MLGKFISLCALFTLFYIVLTLINEGMFKNKIDDTIKNLNSKFENRVKNEDSFYISKKRNKKLTHIDDLIKRSGIRDYIPITSEMIIMLTIVISVVFFIGSCVFTKNRLLQIEFGALGFMLPKLVLEEVATRRFNLIDDKILMFIDTAINFSQTKNEALYIFQNTAMFLNGPLKNIIEQLANELNRGIPANKAFDNAIDSTDNIRFKQVIRNLYNVSEKDADYKGVLEKARDTHERYYDQKLKASRKIKSGKISMVSLIVIIIIMINGAGNFAGGDLLTFLESNAKVQFVVGYFGLITLLMINRFCKMNKFNV